ncbi:UDP-3-O-acyl-N-acetylglucosamine deacetylase [Algicola sagamiensis]|uniref:UDP-3-O-acyl-N-acetylglucosamine deacetylase n=1 Tax=Algicola sagamiensis TaxID=163869 RepID=UPI00036D3987|nr:UDP-3-O-acyl-N-acetylglucosamine deacetylase [Algicola sagamiensis]
MVKQRTIKQVIQMTGVGLHKGDKVELTLRPAPANTGIIFRRVDLDPVVEFKVSPELVGDTTMCTCLVNEDQVKLSTTEHLMSALAGLGVDNIVIDVDSPEIPVMDGSSMPFVYILCKTGFEELSVAKRFIKVKKPIRVEDGDKWAELLPSDQFKIDFTIDFDHPVISSSEQRFVMEHDAQTYVEHVSRARTFGFMREVEFLRANNLALGASMENAVVLDEFKVLNETGLRYDDEFVKHKVLDAIGDLYMSGLPLLAEFKAFKSGHALNNVVLRALMADTSAWEIVTFEEETSAAPDFAIPDLSFA